MAHEISPTHSKKDFKKTIKQTNNQKKEKGYFFGTAREEYMSVSSVDYCGGMAIINEWRCSLCYYDYSDFHLDCDDDGWAGALTVPSVVISLYLYDQCKVVAIFPGTMRPVLLRP